MQFTWNEKFTRMFEKLQGGDVAVMLKAVCQYGTDGIEPTDLPYPLDAMFESVRDDIDFSHSKRSAGGKGGASGRKQARTPGNAEADVAPSTDATNECALDNGDSDGSASSTLTSDDSASSKNTDADSALSKNSNSDSASSQYIAIQSNTEHCNTEEPPKAPLPYDEIVGMLNDRAGTSFKPSSKKTRGLIQARFNEGFSTADFEAVIDSKVAEWRGDAEMSRYLRPETLFGPKFEGYLQTAPLAAKARSNPISSMQPDYSGEGW